MAFIFILPLVRIWPSNDCSMIIISLKCREPCTEALFSVRYCVPSTNAQVRAIKSRIYIWRRCWLWVSAFQVAQSPIKAPYQRRLSGHTLQFNSAVGSNGGPNFGPPPISSTEIELTWLYDVLGAQVIVSPERSVST
jgi:hypothetical protein